MNRLIARALLAAAIVVGTASALARADSPVQLILKDHRFTPNEITLPAGRRTTLEVTNADAAADEFEMRQLAIEKIVPAGGKVLVGLHPLAPGRYQFVGEFNEATAKGTIIVVPADTK
jgi:heme/copper-type cytochrome/quinol oxidase subunit 2